jgi:hypothetical protein
MVKVSEAFPSKYLKGVDIGDTRPTWRIRSYGQEDMPGGEQKWVLYFENEQKGLVLNRTNADVCAGQFGDDLDDWIGQRVGLFTMPINFNGKITDSIRLRAAPKVKPKPKPIPDVDVDDEIPGE